jgi:hypothetical protein
VTLARLRGSPRASWWITFLLLAALGLAWALASPPTAAPDERDHVANAVAVARGQLLGDALTKEQKLSLAAGRGRKSSYRAIDIPEIYDNNNTSCFAFLPDANASCFHWRGSDRIVPVLNPVVWYPPTYYAVIGLVARPFDPGRDSLYAMRFVGVLIMAALLASAVVSLRRSSSPALRMVAFLVALTPMALFLAASVNPSGPEIVAGIALWASGTVLVREALADGTVDGRVVLRVGIAATVLAVSRQDAPLWLGLIVLTLGLLAGRTGWRALWASTALRIWGVVVVVCTAAQVAWVFGVGTLAPEHSVFRATNLSSNQALRESVGNSFRWYHEMIGWFGWLDAPSPMLTVVIWTMALGGLVVLALAFGRRRWTVATLAVLVLAAALPIALEYLQSQGIGAGHWQGRYALPFAAGVPILAAFSLEPDGLDRRVAKGVFPVLVGAALALAQFAAFTQNLRRYTVGYNGKVWYFVDPAWSPPLGAAALTIGFGVVVALTFVWLLGRVEVAKPREHADTDVEELSPAPASG